MGYNTALILLNDALGDIERDPDIGKRIADAVDHLWSGYLWSGRRNSDQDIAAHGRGIYCNAMTAICTAHADETQVVVIGGNYGRRVNWQEGDERDLNALAEVLRMRGYAVRKPGKRRADPPWKWNKENWVRT